MTDLKHLKLERATGADTLKTCVLVIVAFVLVALVFLEIPNAIDKEMSAREAQAAKVMNGGFYVLD